MRRPMAMAVLTAGALAIAGCDFDLRIASDAGPFEPGDASADASPLAAHLMLSEVKTSNDILRREFIEIFNPTDFSIDLRNYYLSDTADYARLPAFVAGLESTLDPEDFIARFPGGAYIPGRSVLVVALRTHPSWPAVAELTISSLDGTPAMDEAFSGSIGANNVIDLSNDDGEGIALFYWDQVSDLVSDVDLFNAGYDIAPANMLANKSGMSVDGPDEDSEATVYLGDAHTMPMPARSNGVNESFQRLAPEHGAEIGVGGNGLEGHDETSEQINDTWGIAADTPGELAGTLAGTL